MSSYSDTDTSLIRGGPFYRIQAAAHLIAPDRWNLGRRTAIAIAIGWVPLLLITVADNPGAIRSLITDYAVNARILISIPVLLAGQVVMDALFRQIVYHIRDASLLGPSAQAEVDLLVYRLRRLRDSWIPESVIVVLAYARIVSLLRLGSHLEFALPWALVGTGADAHLTGAGWYYAVVSQLLYQFLLGISLWKWLLWTYFLYRLSRLRLQLVPTHPDQRGGLGFLDVSPLGIAPTLFAASTAIGATWRAQILGDGAHLVNFGIPAAALLFLGFIIGLGPLLLFVPTLTRLRRRGVLDYGTLGQIHSTKFHQKWIVGRSTEKEDFLAAPEVSTMIDYASSYQMLEGLRPLPVRREALFGLSMAIALPLIPVIVAEIPMKTILKGLLNALV